MLISTLTFVLETLPYFDKENSEYPICVIILEVIDQAAVIFFTIEYVVRFMCSPRKWRFLKGLSLRNMNPAVKMSVNLYIVPDMLLWHT